jgi:thioredoxin-related protein
MQRRLFLIGACAAVALPAAGRAGDPQRIEPVRMDDGRYTQPWFLTSFLILKDDLADSAAQNKRLALMWDQVGCPYCKEMERVNLADPAVNRYIRERFNIIQLDLNGLREVTDFDGQVLAEKDLARKYGVVGTPTIQFLPPAQADVVGKIGAGKSGRAVEDARMPGYLQPGLFEAMFAFVYDRAYERQTFRQYVETHGGPAGVVKTPG